MLIYGYELEFVIHHDFVRPIVVNLECCAGKVK